MALTLHPPNHDGVRTVSHSVMQGNRGLTKLSHLVMQGVSRDPNRADKVLPNT